MMSIEAYYAFVGRFCNRLRHFANIQNVVSIRCGNVYTILLFLHFSLLYLPILLHALFALFLLVVIDPCFVNSVRFKRIDYSCHFLELHHRVYNLNFLKLEQLCIDSDVESNPVFKGTAINCDLSENNVNVASDPKVKNSLFNTIPPVSLNIIMPWSVTCPSNLE